MVKKFSQPENKSEQQSKTQRSSVYKDVKQKNNYEAESSKCLTFLLLLPAVTHTHTDT